MRVYDRFADEYIDELEKDPIAPPERYMELSEELILQNAARWFCQALGDDSAEKELVRVIRCKDCKYYTAKQGGLPWNNSRRYCNRSVNLATNPDDFCSYGERMEE